MHLKTFQKIGLGLLVIGLLLPIAGININGVFSQTAFGSGPIRISLSTPGAIYVNTPITITADLGTGMGTPDTSLNGQFLFLYVDGQLITSGATSGAFVSTSFSWTPSATGTHSINVTWAGNSAQPSGTFTETTVTVASHTATPPPGPQPFNYSALLNVFSILGAALLVVGGRFGK
jgi:hypothetical protein